MPITQAVEAERPDALQRNSESRYAHANETVAATASYDEETLMALLRDERSICRRPEPPFDYESSGAVVMRPSHGDMWACWGIPSENRFEHFSLGAPAAP